MFEIELPHWIEGGSNSLESLLQKDGFILERAKGSYDPDLFPDIANATCRDANDTFSFEDDSEELSSSSAGASWKNSSVSIGAAIAAALGSFIVLFA